ncbi:response regulator transcription factor [Singulisphaera sp. Ch08]|uniref:Response regulator transcription factor n=1 Tax=Singulisphaera sp. Ch08 TaxID=3120278 RepID=A0AAU7CEA4_9BACT
MDPIRVLVADDHTLVRAGIRALLQALEGVEVVAEAGDGREALALARAHRPDILLTDIAMPLLSGLELAGVVARELETTRVVILSMHASEEYARRALEAGAAGYLLKDSGLAELEIAVRAVARGETYLSPAVSKHVIAEYLRRTDGAPATGPLTPRQCEILRLLAEGQTTKGIARRLGISDKTVEAHRAQLMERLGIHDLAGLVRYAIRTGLVGPEE